MHSYAFLQPMRPTVGYHLFALPCRCLPPLFDEFLGTLDVFVELLDLLVVAEALLVIRVELQALADFTGEDGGDRGM